MPVETSGGVAQSVRPGEIVRGAVYQTSGGSPTFYAKDFHMISLRLLDAISPIQKALEDVPISEFVRHAIVKLLKRPGRSQVFGLVFYDVRHPFVKKALDDRDFWAALDALSGRRWAIFTPEVSKDLGAPSVADARAALDSFGLVDEADRLPFLVIAAVSQHDGRLMTCQVPIETESAEAAFNSMREAVEIASKAIDRIEASNLKNTEEIFRVVESEFRQKRELSILRQLLSVVPIVRNVAEALKKLSPRASASG
jgi:hypothetical protein